MQSPYTSSLFDNTESSRCDQVLITHCVVMIPWNIKIVNENSSDLDILIVWVRWFDISWYFQISRNAKISNTLLLYCRISKYQKQFDFLIWLPISSMISKRAGRYNYFIPWLYFGLYMALTLQTFTVDIKYSWIIILFWKMSWEHSSKTPTLCASHESLVSILFQPLWYFGTIMTVT